MVATQPEEAAATEPATDDAPAGNAPKQSADAKDDDALAQPEERARGSQQAQCHLTRPPDAQAARD